MKRIKIFFSSPSDVEKERSLAREVVRLVNDTIPDELGFQFRLILWEDYPQKDRRQQDFLNKLIDECDIFVGLIWERLGTPDGDSPSRFQEEVMRALKRFEASGKPDLLLYSKTIQNLDISKVDEQLLAAISFRERMKDECQFTEVSNEDDWKYKFQHHLDMMVKGLFSDCLAKTTTVSPPQSSLPEIAVQHSEDSPKRPLLNPAAKDKIIQLLSDVRNKVEIEDDGVIDVPSNARLYLLAAAWFSRTNPAYLLDTHTINFLYTGKENFAVTYKEAKLLLRSIVSDAYGVNPGYYWLKDWQEKPLQYDLYSTVCIDQSPDVRVGIFRLLELARLTPNLKWKDYITQDTPQSVKLAFLKYAITCEVVEETQSDAFIDVLRVLCYDIDEGVSKEAMRAKLKIVARQDPNLAFEELLAARENASINNLKSILDDFHNKRADIRSELLREAFNAKENEFRVFAAENLAERNELSNDEARSIAQGDAPSLISVGLSYLLDNRVNFEFDYGNIGKKFGLYEAEIILLKRYEKLPPEDLLKEINFFNANGSKAYLSLALNHFSLIENRIRTDIDNRFGVLFEESVERIRTSQGSLVAERLKGSFSKKGLNIFVINLFTAAALSGLAAHGNKEDAKIARQFLTESEFNPALPEAIKILKKFGDAGDVSNLIQLAKSEFGKIASAAADAAISLSPGIDGASKDLIKSSRSQIVKLALEVLSKESPNCEMLNEVRQLLYREDTEIRNFAVSYLVRVLEEEELERLLAEYMTTGESYYYNVVCLLDKFLYAPQPLGSAFRDQIKAILD